MCSFEDIQKANASIVTMDFKGKPYAEVNQRIKAFRQVHPNGSIIPEITSLEDGIVTMKATIATADGLILAVGHAQEKELSSYINKTSYIENCETSAIGRALGMCGFGIDTSLSSLEEVTEATKKQEDLQNLNMNPITTPEEKRIKDIALKKFGKDAVQEKMKPILEPFKAIVVKDLKMCDIEAVIEAIENAD